MRTWQTIQLPGGEPIAQYVPLDDGKLSDIENLLSRQHMAKLTLEYSDGRTISYEAIEYECEWCGSYAHKSPDCPEIQTAWDEAIREAP